MVEAKNPAIENQAEHDIDGIDEWNQPEPAMDLPQRIMAAYDGGESDWCCEREPFLKVSEYLGGTGRKHHANCLLDEARKLCGLGD